MTKSMSTSEPVTAWRVSWISPEKRSSSQSLASLLGTPIRNLLPSAETTDVFLSHMSYVRLASWKRSSSCTCDQIWSWFTSRISLRRRASLTRASLALGRLGASCHPLLQMLWTTWVQSHRPSPPAPLLAKQSLNYVLASTASIEAPPVTSFIFSTPVEKSGPDFHRLAVPIRWKSTIRSVPKSGSGVVILAGHPSGLIHESGLRDLY